MLDNANKFSEAAVDPETQKLLDSLSPRFREIVEKPVDTASAKAPATIYADPETEQLVNSLSPKFREIVEGKKEEGEGEPAAAATPPPVATPAAAEKPGAPPTDLVDKPGIGDDLLNVWNALKRGTYGALQAAHASAIASSEAKMAAWEKIVPGPTDEAARDQFRKETQPPLVENIVELEKKKAEIPATGGVAQFYGGEHWFSAWASNPIEVTASIIAESLPAMAPALATAAVAGPAAGMLATGTSSLNVEYSSGILDAFQKHGGDLTSEAGLSEFFADKERLDAARSYALKRGIPVAIFDAASAGLAGKLLQRSLGKGAAKVLAATAGELGAQAAMGAAGEAGGQLVSEGKISDGRAIFSEAIAEVGSTPVEAYSNLKEDAKVKQESHATATEAVMTMLGAERFEPSPEARALTQKALVARLPETLREPVAAAFASVVEQARAAEAVQGSAPATADEMRAGVRAEVKSKLDEIIYGKVSDKTKVAAEPKPTAGTTAYQYAVNEDPGEELLPGQIGERADSVEHNFGVATLAQKLSPEDASKLNLSLIGETQVQDATPATPKPKAPEADPAPIIAEPVLTPVADLLNPPKPKPAEPAPLGVGDILTRKDGKAKWTVVADLPEHGAVTLRDATGMEINSTRADLGKYLKGGQLTSATRAERASALRAERKVKQAAGAPAEKAAPASEKAPEGATPEPPDSVEPPARAVSKKNKSGESGESGETKAAAPAPTPEQGWAAGTLVTLDDGRKGRVVEDTDGNNVEVDISDAAGNYVPGGSILYPKTKMAEGQVGEAPVRGTLAPQPVVEAPAPEPIAPPPVVEAPKAKPEKKARKTKAAEEAPPKVEEPGKSETLDPVRDAAAQAAWEKELAAEGETEVEAEPTPEPAPKPKPEPREKVRKAKKEKAPSPTVVALDEGPVAETTAAEVAQAEAELAATAQRMAEAKAAEEAETAAKEAVRAKRKRAEPAAKRVATGREEKADPVEKSEGEKERSPQNDWVDAQFRAYATLGQLTEYFHQGGKSIEDAAKLARGVLRDRVAAGQTTNEAAMEGFTAKALHGIYELAKQHGTGISAKLDDILSGDGVNIGKRQSVAEVLRQNHEATGNPLKRKGADGKVTFFGWAKPILTVATNWHSREGQHLNDASPIEGGASADTGISQAEFDQAEIEAAPSEGDTSAPTGAYARMGQSPARAIAAKEIGEVRSKFFARVAEMLKDFVASPEAVAGTEAETTATEEDVERAVLSVLPEEFRNLFFPDLANKIDKGKTPGFLSLKGDETFAENVQNFLADVREEAAKIPELRPRLSLLGTGVEATVAGEESLSAEAAADAIDAEIAGLPPVVRSVLQKTSVVQSDADLPWHLRTAIAERGATGRVKGLFDPMTGRIYLVADNLRSAEDAVATLLHEGVGEHGIDGVLGAENWAQLSKTLLAGSAAQGIAKTYHGKELALLSPDQRDSVAREVLAHLAENETAEPSVRQRILDTVRSILRLLGLVGTYTDADIAQIVRKARAYTGGVADPGAVRFKLDGVAEETPQEKVAREYRVKDGAAAFLGEVAKRSVNAKGAPTILSQLANILAKQVGKGVTVDLDAALREQGMNGVALIGEGRIKLDPNLDQRQFHLAAIEEIMHLVLFDKLEAYSRGEFEDLSATDMETIGNIASLYETALANAPKEIQDLVGSSLTDDEKADQFLRWADEGNFDLHDWYHALDLHEFVAGVFTDGVFQAKLAAIEAGDVTDAKAPRKSLVKQLWNSFLNLVAGGKVPEGSALHSAAMEVMSLLDNNHAVRSRIDRGRDRELGSLRTILRATVARGAAGWNAAEPYRTAFVRFLQDRFIDLKKAQDRFAATRSLASIPETEDAYRAAELYHGRVGDRLHRFVQQYAVSIGDRIRHHGLTVAQVDEFLYARHAAERNNYIGGINPRLPDGGSGMSDADAQATLARYGALGLTPALNDVATLVDAMTQESLRTMRNSGLITAEAFTAMSNRYQHYVTLQGFENEADGAWTDGTEGILPNVGRGFDMRGVEPKRALGRRSKATDIITNTVESAARVLIRAEKNRVGRSMANLIRNNPDPALWREVDPQYEHAQAFDARAHGGAGAVRRQVDQNFRRREDIIAYKENGEERFFQLHHESMAKNWKNGGNSTQSTIGNAIQEGLGAFMRYKAIVNTQYNPEFVVTNLFRDIQSALLNMSGPEMEAARSGTFQDLADRLPFAAIARAYGRTRLAEPLLMADDAGTAAYLASFDEMQRHGGQIIFFGLENAQTGIADAIRAVQAGNVRRFIGTLGSFISDYNGIVENGTRLAVYHNLRKNGASPDSAAHAARNVTVNFNRKGEAGPALNALYLFFNANVQSTARIFESMRSRDWKQNTALLGGLASFGFAMASMARYVGGRDPGDDRDRWDKIPDYIRHTNMIFFLPESLRQGLSGIPGVGKFLSEDGNYVKFPMPYGYNWFVNVGTTAEKYLLGNSMTAPHALADIAGSALDTWNPVGGAGTILQQITPTVGRVLVDPLLNKDFAGNPLKPEPSPFAKFDPPPHTQYFNSVSPVIRNATDGANALFGGTDARGSWASVSPEHVEYAIDFALGSVGSFVSRALSAGYVGVKHATGTPVEPLPVNNVPFVRRFGGNAGSSDTRAAYGMLRDEALRTKADVEGQLLAGDPERAQKIANEGLSELALTPLIESIDQKRMGLHTQIQALRAKPIDGRDDPDMLRTIAALQDADTALQQQAIKVYVQLKRSRGEAADVTRENYGFKKWLGLQHGK